MSGGTTIRINNDKNLTVTPGRSLLATLRDEGIFLSSGCGGRGACGLCRVRVTRGAGPTFSASEQHWLTDKERNDGFRLACQVKVANDLDIEVTEAAFGIRQYQTEVVSIRDLTPDVKELRLRLIQPGKMDFKAGQFIHFKVPPYDKISEPVYRAYSIASDPSVEHEIEIEVKHVGNGISTTYIHKYLKVGDEVTIIGPDGDLYLRDSNRDIIFMAGGSGMAPIRSMLLDMLSTHNRRKATFFFGVKTAKDLVLADEMRKLESRLTGFRYIPALSEPAQDEEWNGEKGLVTEVFDRLIKSDENCEAYLCGSPPMINACLKVIRSKGIPDARIFYDRFV